MKFPAILSLLLFSALTSSAKVEVGGLTVEGRQEPAGIDVASPRFGWRIVSDEKNVVQKSYHIIVSSSLEKLDLDRGDVWDSHIVLSDSSQWVSYKSSPLKPDKVYYWKVKVVTNHGETRWSDSSLWSTGLLCADNWKGCWIGLDSIMPWDVNAGKSRISARYLRKEFKSAGDVVRATAHISGLGVYALYINGKKVGNDVLTPSPTDFDKTVIYNTYDVTSLIRPDNAVGVILNAGRYFAMRQNRANRTFGYPKLLINIIIEYADGSVTTVASDDTWSLNADGAVRYANYYDGETYDARKEFNGWTVAGFDDSRWSKASSVTAPRGLLKGNLLSPLCVYAIDKPVTATSAGNRHILDFGTNGAGRLRFSVKGNAGDTVVVRYAELLKDGGTELYVKNLRTAECTDRYICNGTKSDWTSDYVYHGFRYAEVTVPEGAVIDGYSRELISDNMSGADTEISISESGGSSVLNTIIANARRGVRSNYKGMPLDCPQRDERMPWLGDRTTGSLGESYLFNNHDLYSKWMADICQSQRTDGNISDVAPDYWQLYTSNMTWPAALPFTCDMLYRQYGDIQPMKESYGSIKRWLRYMRSNFYDKGLITKDKYGDWCVPPESPMLIFSKDSARITDGALISSTYYFHICRMMQRYALMTGNAADVSYYRKEADTMADAINRNYLKDGSYSNGTVTANLLPLAMGIVPKKDRDSVGKKIIETIVDKYSTHLSAGVVGIQWLMRQLSEMGQGNVAYQLATTDTYPGWGYMVKNGATTIWELWNGNTADPSMNSGNHVMLLGDLLPWCYEDLAGIRSDNVKVGFKHIILKPDFSIRRLSRVAASHPSPYGVIRSCWTRSGNAVEWSISIPANTTADLYLPGGKVRHIGSGDYTLHFRN